MSASPGLRPLDHAPGDARRERGCRKRAARLRPGNTLCSWSRHGAEVSGRATAVAETPADKQAAGRASGGEGPDSPGAR
jgi:hypothetical protein